VRFRAVLSLIRPLDGVSAAGMVVLGGLIGGGERWVHVVPAAVATFAAMSFAMAANDCIDQVGDRVNGRPRPLALGLMDERTARVVVVVSAGASVLAASFDGATGLLVIASYLLLSWIYSRHLKAGAAVAGPLTVSALCGSTVVFGGLVASHPYLTVVPAATAAVFTFGREVLKAARDEAGDRVQGCRTFAIVHGRLSAVRWYAGASVLGGGLAATPLLLGAGPMYGVFAVLNLLYLLALALYVGRRPGAAQIARVVKLSKVPWVLWIVAMILFWG
jgi:geranylgeranylglycerol-phosphate geranylgeranyltransferase